MRSCVFPYGLLCKREVGRLPLSPGSVPSFLPYSEKVLTYGYKIVHEIQTVPRPLHSEYPSYWPQTSRYSREAT